MTHLVWLDPFSVLTFSDWSYWHNTPVKELWYSWGAWVGFFNSGAANIQIPFIVFNGVWSLLAHIGFSYDQAVKVTFLAPIAILGFLSPYILFRKLQKSYLLAFVIALFYGSTTYFLVKQAAHLPIAFVYCLTPLLIYTFLRALERSTVSRWALFVLLYLIGLGYEVRIMIIATFILALFYIIYYLRIENIHRMRLIQLGVVGVVAVATSAFWILPSIMNAGAIGAVAERGLFGDFLFNLAHALTLSEFSWTGTEPSSSFILQPIIWYMWFWPIAAFAAFLFYKKFDTVQRRELFFFGLLALAGIFLTKQSTAPFDASYLWLYDHIPGFSLFREASKFYLLTAFGYAGLIGLTLVAVGHFVRLKFKQPLLVLVPIAVIVILSSLNLAPMILGQFGTMFTPRHIPHNYEVLNSYIDQQPSFFRTLWLPVNSRWGLFSDKHPIVSAANEVQTEWRGLLDFDSHPTNWSVQDQTSVLMRASYAQKVMREASIRYVIVPLRDTANDDDFFAYYGNNREFYTKLLDGIPWLKRVDIGTHELAVYENTLYAPRISVLSSAVQVSQTTSIDPMYSFLQDTGHGEAALLTVGQPLTGIQTATNLFDPMKLAVKDEDSVQDTYVSESSKPAMLYKNTGSQLLGYRSTGSDVTFYMHGLSNPVIGGVTIPFSGNTPDQTLSKFSLRGQAQYYISLDSKLVPLEVNKQAILGDSTHYQDVNVSKLGNSLIPNGSFEGGSWRTAVDDCNNYDDHPDISMSLNRQSYLTGGQSLQLEARRHTACTSMSFNVKGGEHAILRLGYQGGDAKQAGYYLIFNDSRKTVVSDTVPINDKDWHRLVKDISVPKDATSASLALYSYESDGSTRNIVRYDDVNFNELDVIGSVKLPQTPLTYANATVNLQKGSNVFTYSQPGIKNNNQIVNGSFEDGLWNTTVGDCNNYDRNPILAQRLNTELAIDGHQSLQLEATRHNACASTQLTLGMTGDQLLSFDYRSPNTKQAGYYLSFNDAHHTAIGAPLPIMAHDEWQHFQRRVIVPDDATSASLALYSYQSDGHMNNIVLYDNVSLNKTPDATDSFYLLTGEQQLVVPKLVTTTEINPTKQVIRISSATKPFMLTSSEAYSDGWKLYALPLNQMNCSVVREYAPQGGGRVQECRDDIHFAQVGDIVRMSTTPIFDGAQHVRVNRYANGWIIDPAYIKQNFDSSYYKENSDGSLDMNLVIYYRPQSYYYVGLLVTGGVVGVCIAALGYDAVLRIWRYHHRIRFR